MLGYINTDKPRINDDIGQTSVYNTGLHGPSLHGVYNYDKQHESGVKASHLWHATTSNITLNYRDLSTVTFWRWEKIEIMTRYAHYAGNHVIAVN